MGRPKFGTRKDATSHKFVRQWLMEHNCHPVHLAAGVKQYTGGYVRGFPIFAIDTSDIGGLVDWLLWFGHREDVCISCAWECKEPKHEKELTEGEVYWKSSGPTKVYIIQTLEDCDRAAKEIVDRLIVLNDLPL